MSDEQSSQLIDRRNSSRADFRVTIAMSVVPAALMAVLELVTGGGLVPIVVYVACAFVCGLLLLPIMFERSRVQKVVVYVVLLAALYAVWAVPFTSRKLFISRFGRVKPGMTMAQVELIMRPYEHTGDQLVAERMTRQLIYRRTADSTDGADWGIVSLRDGRVVRREFWAD